MAARGATTWTTGPGLRWFVRATAVLVGLANLAALPLWFGDPNALRDDTSSGEVLVPVIATLIAGLATSEIVLRVFGVPGRTFFYRYSVVATSVSLGGAIMGFPLSVQFAIDGTLGVDPPPSLYADPFALLAAVVSTLPVGLVGAAFGLVIGMAEGLVLAFPLASVLGVLRSED
jgi:hypothetical protein